MASGHVDKKRKIVPVEDEYDSDCIIVEPAKASKIWPIFAALPAKRRSVLDDLDAPQVHNKGGRTLKCVLIPSSSDQRPHVQTTATDETQQTGNANEQKLLNSQLVGTLALDEASSESERIIMQAQNDDIIMEADEGDLPITKTRPKRNAKRQSSLVQPFLEGSSEDESVAPTTKLPQRRRAQKRVALSDHSDFEENEDAASSELDVDADDFDDGSSVPSFGNDDLSDVEDIKQVPSSRANPVSCGKSSSKIPAAGIKGKKKPAPAIKPDQKMTIIRKRGATSKEPLGLDESLPPLSDPKEMFADMARKAVSLGFGDVAKHVGRRPIRVATMCSGTESPLHAMQMFQHALGQSTELDCEIEHLFSAEIEPVKQAYIERNYSPPILFRDVTELTSAMKMDRPMATTAYGAKVDVPIGVDMVIAGTSCIDFSNLNNYKKTLDDDGQSGQTWNGVLAYCTVARPPIVIIENVLSAPWEVMIKYYEDAGYDTAVVHLDSKDYYVPQTRQRGYLVAFDKGRCEEQGVSGPAAQWQGLMKKFRRYASSPHVSFLLPNDRISRRIQIRTEEVTREVNWSLCELRHIRYRHELRLGIDRPYTHWQESGTIVVPEGWDASWLKVQVERVKDTIECAILRNMLETTDKVPTGKKPTEERRRMFDSMYKTRIWNLSQNIDREEDGTPWGVAGCITPSAQFFVSAARRAMMPEEQMMLQGFCLDKISFTTETPAEIQDLSGNAMTTTVIGSAIISALISGHRLLPQEGIPTKQTGFTTTTSSATKLVTGPTEIVDLSSEHAHMDVDAFILAARRALRKCVCEGRSGVAAKPIQKCIDCGHTVCVSCGGEPPHNFQQGSLLFPDRRHPLAFEKEWKGSLPLKLVLASAKELLLAAHGDRSDSKLSTRYQEAVKLAASETFDFTQIRRTHCWTVMYEGASARLELVVDAQSAAWRIYAKSDAKLAANDPLRQALEQPVLRLDLEEDPKKQQWQIRKLSPQSVAIQITRGDNLMASQWQRNQMPDFLDHVVPEHLHFEICEIGSFDDSQHSLEPSITGKYRHLPKCGKACHSLWVKEKSQAEVPDIYLFLDPTRTGHPKDDSFVFTTTKAELEHDEVRPVLARVDPSWRPWSKGGGAKVRQTKVTFDGVWTTLPRAFQLKPAVLSLQLLKPKTIVVSSDCNQPSLLMACTTASNSPTTSKKYINQGSKVAFEAMRRYLPDSGWQPLQDADVNSPCTSCAPPKPSLKWELDSKNGTIKPYEDPLGAARYERAVKAGVDPVVIEAESQGSGHTTIRFGVHLKTLAHRAAARLPLVASDARTEWRLDTNANRAPANVPDFQLRSTSEVAAFTGDLGMSVTLFPIQQRALAWMRQQEAGNGQQFTLEECEEATSSEAGWRAEVRVKVPVCVRGGICADHPGFGKTITTLALMRGELLEKSPAAIAEEVVHHNGTDLIAVSAYLIVCPGTLVKQWVGEIRDKIGYKDVLVINTMVDLSKCTMQSFKTAQFIVVNRSVLTSETYAEKLATFVGVPGPATKSGSSYEAWLNHALRRMPDHLQILKDSGVKVLQQQVKEEYKRTISSDTFEEWVPSRRTRGIEKETSSKKTSGSITAQPAAAALNTSTIGTPLFEMFCFARLVIDEFQQYDAKELTALKNIKADKRWALSGTPPLNDTYEVAQLAALLGVHLPTGASARGRMKLKNIRKMEKDRTDFERFDAMRQIPSEEAHARLHEHHQSFLDAFGRRNILEEGNIPYEEHLVPVELDLDHRVRYAEISQQLNSLGMRIPKGNKTGVLSKTDKRSRVFRAVEGIESPEEALSRDAAYADRQKTVDLDAWIHKREQERKKTSVNLERAITEIHNAKGSKKSKAAADRTEDWRIWQKSRLKEGTLGDDETIKLIESIASGEASIASVDHSGSDSEDDQGQGNPMGKIMGLSDQLLLSQRSLRYLKGVREIQEASKVANHTVKCDSLHCNGVPFTDHGNSKLIAVSAHCGHKLCKTCHHTLRDQYHTRCPAPGCRGTVEDYHLLWNHKMGKAVSGNTSPFGSKWKTAVDLLEDIREKKDQAILFVQYANQLDEARTVLFHAGISASIVQPGPQANDLISAFQDKTQNIAVIVLNASDETAAGLNLQNANHVIFLSPLLRDTQYGYDSTMKQAIGRVRRYGQQKLIHVHHLVALDTIDVDILEHRARRTTAMKERSAVSISKPAALVALDLQEAPKLERTQLIRENGQFSLRPQSWLVMCGAEEGEDGSVHAKGKSRVLGYEDFSSQVKFSKAYTEDDD